MLIGGEWRRAASSEEIEVVNPATEDVVGSVPSAAPADVELAVATAKRAFPEWAATDVEKRAQILAEAAALIEERAKDLAALLTSEQGKPIAEARGEVTHLAHGVRYYAEAATKVRGAYQELPSAFGPAYGQVIRRPIGVCAAITPYNFPLTLLGTKVAPALASGNTVVAKPASTTPLATLEVARIFAEAGVPDGVLNVVTGPRVGDRRRARRPPRRAPRSRSPARPRSGRHVMSVAGPAAEARDARARRLGPGDRVRGRRRRRGGEGGDHRPLLERRPGVPRLQARVRRTTRSTTTSSAQLVERVERYEPGDGTVEGREAAAADGPDPHPQPAATSWSRSSRTASPRAARC